MLLSRLLSYVTVFQAALMSASGLVTNNASSTSVQCPVKWSWGPWSDCDAATCTRFRRRRCELPLTCSKEVCMQKIYAKQRAVVRRYRPCSLKDRLNICKTRPSLNRHWGSTPFVNFNVGSRLFAFRKPSRLWRQLTPVYIEEPLMQKRFRRIPTSHGRPNNYVRLTRNGQNRGGEIEFFSMRVNATTTTTSTAAPSTSTSDNEHSGFSSFAAFFGQWSAWSSCEPVDSNNKQPPTCAQIRTRVCSVPSVCGDYVLLHRRRCRTLVCLQKIDNATKTVVMAFTISVTKQPTTTDDNIQAIHPSHIRQLAVIPSTLAAGSTVSKQCGVSEILSYQKTPRIIGGRLVPRGKWPWMVVLINRRGEQFCGGALIASQWVLTAAHCLDRVSAIRVGEHALDRFDPGEVTLRPAAIFAHPNYNPDDFDSDIGLVLLDRPLNFSKFIISACLPPPERERSAPVGMPEVGGGLRAGTMCTVVGWGKLAEHYPTGSARPREVRVPIVSRQACRKAYADQLTSTQICAGYLAGGRDSCGGDSGGPLMCQEPITISERSLDANGQPHTSSRVTFRWIVEGLVSHGDGCGLQNKYGVYTRVDAFTDWVNAIVSRPEAFLGK